MYNCPHCDEGPFNAGDWWDHMATHNTPWLQSRKPSDLERTDLGYGEDIQGMTTVPTHNLPNEPGFNPEKFGANLVDNPEQYAQYLVQNGLNHGLDIKTLFSWVSQRLIYDLHMQPDDAHLLADEIIPHVQTLHHTANLPDVHAHRIVWLSQPNNQSLKYWHHNPSNTTYAWDAGMPYDNNPTSPTMHHIHMWDKINPEQSGMHPRGNDWEGGFWMNQVGKHPADLWGLPSQVDYAPIQGDGDYGNSVF